MRPELRASRAQNLFSLTVQHIECQAGEVTFEGANTSTAPASPAANGSVALALMQLMALVRAPVREARADLRTDANAR